MGLRFSAALVWAGLFAALAVADDASTGLRLNQIQVIGTHNSYKVRAPEPAFSRLLERYPQAITLDYAHPALDVQLDRGVRSFEIDVYYYPERDEHLRVMHVPRIDEESNVRTWKRALRVIKRWSDMHPGHVPISVLVEAKDDPIEELGITVNPFTTEAFALMDAQIREVFPEERLLTPDDVRGGHATLPEAIAADGWPLLDEVRGQVFFCLHERGGLAALYAESSPVTEGRAMFLRGEEGKPWSAVFVIDNPRDPALPDHVRRGYIVRTRADADLKEPRQGDTSRFEAALASGAHILSTDYPASWAYEPTNYVVEFPRGAVARANPVSAPDAEKRLLFPAKSRAAMAEDHGRAQR